MNNPCAHVRCEITASVRDLTSRPSPLDASRSPTLLSLSIVGPNGSPSHIRVGQSSAFDILPLPTNPVTT